MISPCLTDRARAVDFMNIVRNALFKYPQANFKSLAAAFNAPNGLIPLMKKHKVIIPTALEDGFVWNHLIFGGSPHENYEELLKLDHAAQGHVTLKPETEPLTPDQKINMLLGPMRLEIKRLQTDVHNLTKLVHRLQRSERSEE